MEASEQTRFNTQYQHHLRALKLRGMSASTIDVYARAVRRLAAHFDCCLRISRNVTGDFASS